MDDSVAVYVMWAGIIFRWGLCLEEDTGSVQCLCDEDDGFGKSAHVSLHCHVRYFQSQSY